MQHWLPAVPDCIETHKYIIIKSIWEDFQTESFKLHIFCNWSQILCYVMLTRVFSARQYKILNVPLSSHLAANHFNQQQAEQEERMRMKKLTLDINERQEQEDYQGTTPRLSFTLFTVAQEAACEASASALSPYVIEYEDCWLKFLLCALQRWCSPSPSARHQPTLTGSVGHATSTRKALPTPTSSSRPEEGETRAAITEAPTLKQTAECAGCRAHYLITVCSDSTSSVSLETAWEVRWKKGIRRARERTGQTSRIGKPKARRGVG